MTMSTTNVIPYLFFSGRCEEAIAFYQRTIGAEPGMMMRFDESPQPPPAEMLQTGFEKKVMHAEIRVGGATIFCSDGCDDQSTFSGFSLVLHVASEAEAEHKFAALAEGGKVTMPLAKTFWSPKYGMLTDKFGVGWMVMVPEERSPAARG